MKFIKITIVFILSFILCSCNNNYNQYDDKEIIFKSSYHDYKRNGNTLSYIVSKDDENLKEKARAIKTLYSNDLSFIMDGFDITNLDLFKNLESLTVCNRDKTSNIEFLTKSNVIKSLKKLSLSSWHIDYFKGDYDYANEHIFFSNPYISCESLSSIKRLNTFTDLSFLSNANNLQELNIDNLNTCKSISSIKTLSNLKTLRLECFYDDDTLAKNGFSRKDFGFKDYKFINELNDLNSLSLQSIFNIDDFSFIDNNNIKELELCNMNLKSLKGISKLPNLETLIIEDCDIDMYLDEIYDLKNLKKLVINFSNKIPSDFSKLKNLESLEICFSLDISDLDFLKDLNNLKSLSLASLYNLKDIYAINNLKNLKTLNFYCSEIDLLSDLDLESFDNLESISSNYEGDFKCLEYLNRLKNLNNLDLIGYFPNTDNMPKDFKTIDLCDFKNLKTLDISGLSEDLSFLYNIKQLETLNLYGYSNIDYDSLNKYKYLKTLSLNNIDDVDISNINNNNIKNLKLENLHEIKNIEALSNLKNLSKLELNYVHDVDNLNFLNKIKTLNHLVIDSTSNLKTLDCIKDLKNLEYLKLKDLDTLNSLESLKNLINLKTLEIENCKNLNKKELQEIIFTLDNLKKITIK